MSARERRSPWFRLVCVASPDSRWEPVWRLQMNGHGPFLPGSYAQAYQAVDYVADAYPDSYVELPAMLPASVVAR